MRRALDGILWAVVLLPYVLWWSYQDGKRRRQAYNAHMRRATRQFDRQWQNEWRDG